MTSAPKKITPMMAQWHACKEQAPGALLLFRLGDFYEAFHEDAEKLAHALGLVLTERQGVPMSGIPHHHIDTHIDTLVDLGFTVAIAEQMETSEANKALMERKVVRIITRGTLIDSSLIQDKSHNYIVALHQEKGLFGIAILDVSTAEFQVTEVREKSDLYNELDRLKPAELLFSSTVELDSTIAIATCTRKDESYFDSEKNRRFLLNHFQVQSLDGFGLKEASVSLQAAGALLHYLKEDLSLSISHLKKIVPYTLDNHLLIDRATARHLELFSQGKESCSLFSLIDHTQTSLGGRSLAAWLSKPLLAISTIHHRQEAISILLSTSQLLSTLTTQLKKIRDLERLMTRIAASVASPRDFVGLKDSLEAISPIRNALPHIPFFLERMEKLIDLAPLIKKLEAAFVDEPAIKLHEGEVFRKGFCNQLDSLSEMARGSRNWLATYQTELQEKTGIKGLKVNFNRIFGYYIEVSRLSAEKLEKQKGDFERKQTLANVERFTTKELRHFESAALSAEGEKRELIETLFEEIARETLTYFDQVLTIAAAIGEIDAICSLAELARRGNYTKPIVDNSHTLSIRAGRHPLLEKLIARNHFIANDLYLNDKRLALVTGPNMAGKSTYLRMTGHLVILAQIGSFVPADFMHLGIVDKLFARIGASDHLARGQSTFMVEMNETANLLNNASSKTLVLLDEIGRGTSTFDGLAIAWSVAEFLITLGARTLFATHYFELTALEKRFDQVINLHALVQEQKGQIIFLYHIRPGRADRSYGIQVAQLAGLPTSVIDRASKILATLEQKQKKGHLLEKEETSQLLLF